MPREFIRPLPGESFSEDEIKLIAEVSGFDLKRIGNHTCGELLLCLSAPESRVSMSFLLTDDTQKEPFIRVY